MKFFNAGDDYYSFIYVVRETRNAEQIVINKLLLLASLLHQQEEGKRGVEMPDILSISSPQPRDESMCENNFATFMDL